MKLQIKRVDACQRILEIEVPQEAMQKEFETVVNRFQKKSSLPGFRPGKIPRELLLSRFGKNIEIEVLKNTIPHFYVAALKETNLWPLGDPEISRVNWRPIGALMFEAKVEVRPEIKLGNYKGLKINKEIPVVFESEVENELQKIREKLATFNLITDRSLQKGDLAVIDLEIFVEGKPIAEEKNNDFALEVGRDFFGPGFDESLVGLNIGEKKIVEIDLPKGHPIPQFQNKKASFHITLKEIKEKKIPPLNDELASRIKGGQSLDELKQRIKSQLRDWKEKESLQKMKKELIAQLLKSTDFPLPLLLVERRKNLLLKNTREHLKGFGFSEEKIKEEEKRLDEEAQKKAEEELKLALILEAIIEKENIIVSPEEAKEELKKLGQYAGREFQESEIDEGFIEELRHNKVLDFLLSLAKIQEIQPLSKKEES